MAVPIATRTRAARAAPQQTNKGDQQVTMQTRADYLGKHRIGRDIIEILHYDPRLAIDVSDQEPGFYWRDVDEPELIIGPFEDSRQAFDDATERSS